MSGRSGWPGGKCSGGEVMPSSVEPVVTPVAKVGCPSGTGFPQEGMARMKVKPQGFAPGWGEKGDTGAPQVPALTHDAVGQADGLRGHGRLVAHDVGGHQDGLADVGRHHPGRVPLACRQPRVRHVVGAGGHLPALAARERGVMWGGDGTRVCVCVCK